MIPKGYYTTEEMNAALEWIARTIPDGARIVKKALHENRTRTRTVSHDPATESEPLTGMKVLRQFDPHQAILPAQPVRQELVRLIDDALDWVALREFKHWAGELPGPKRSHEVTTVGEFRRLIEPMTEDCPVLVETGVPQGVNYEYRDQGYIVIKDGVDPRYEPWTCSVLGCGSKAVQLITRKIQYRETWVSFCKGHKIDEKEYPELTKALLGHEPEPERYPEEKK